MDDTLDLVLAKSSPPRDRSNEAETFFTPKRRSRGEESRPRGEDLLSFDDLRKQLSLWQSHLTELTTEQREAEKLRQDTSCLRSKLMSCEAEASDRARRLVETRVQVQQKSQDLVATQEQLNKKFIELAQEKEACQELRLQIRRLSEEKEVQEQRSLELTRAHEDRARLEMDLAEARAELAANQVEAARLEALQSRNQKLDDLVKQMELQLKQQEECQAERVELLAVREDLDEKCKLLGAQEEKLKSLKEQAGTDRRHVQELELELAELKDSSAQLEVQHHQAVHELNKLNEAQELAGRREEGLVQDLEQQKQEVQRLRGVECSLQATLQSHSQQLASSMQEQQQAQRQLQALEKVHADSLERHREAETWKVQAEAEQAQAAALRLEVEQTSTALEAAQQEASLWKERAEAMLGRRKAVMQVAARWQGSDAAWDWLMEQGAQELCDLPEGSELRLQNRELCLSLRQFKQDCELLEAENLSLKEAMACMEQEWHRVSDQHAQLVGHVNHRQKIRYTMKLKEEINRLCGELKKARQRIVQLEVSKESENLFDALASVVGSPLVARKPRTGRPCAKLRSKPRGTAPGDDYEIRLADAEQLCVLQQGALDRISMDFQHLKALMERTVMLADSERRKGSEGNFAALLHRLREIIATQREAVHVEPTGLPVAATSIACDDDDELAEGDVICYPRS